jgi:two-component system, NtrC family, sensor kinase
MSEAVLARIWEPFFTTKGKQGTGLGLDISRRLIENHGGRISCASQPGRGTTFEITLPRLSFSAAGLGQALSRTA